MNTKLNQEAIEWKVTREEKAMKKQIHASAGNLGKYDAVLYMTALETGKYE
jgi:hypothetical protein